MNFNDTKLLVALLLLPLSFLFGQMPTQEGEITMLNGEKISGTFNFDDSYSIPDVIEHLNNGAVTTYTPEQLSDIKIGERKFISRKVEINITEQNPQKLNKKIETELITKHVFLRTVVVGEASLFIYKKDRTHYYVSKGEEFVELIQLYRYTENKKSTYNKYLGQLSLLLKDCVKEEEINRTPFGINGLKKIVNKYNTCKTGGSSYIEKNLPFKTNIYLIAGYKASTYDINKEINGEEVFPLEANSGSPTFGLAIEFNLLKKSDRFQIYNELLYQTYNFETYLRQDRLADQFYNEYRSKMDVAYVDLTSSIRYNMGSYKTKVKPFLALNMTNGFLINDNSTEDLTIVFFDSTDTFEQKPFDGEIKSYRVSFSLSLGLVYKNLKIEGRYGFSPSLSDGPTVAKSTNMNILLSYKLF